MIVLLRHFVGWLIGAFSPEKTAFWRTSRFVSNC